MRLQSYFEEDSEKVMFRRKGTLIKSLEMTSINKDSYTGYLYLEMTSINKDSQIKVPVEKPVEFLVF